MSKRTVIILEHLLPDYLRRGYVQTVWESARGSAYLPEHLRVGLVCVETSEPKHEALNQLPKAYMLDGPNGDRISGKYRVVEVGLQERGEEYSYVAGPDGSDCVPNCDVYESRHLCAEGNKALLMDEVRRMREAADSIEAFLRGMEVL